MAHKINLVIIRNLLQGMKEEEINHRLADALDLIVNAIEDLDKSVKKLEGE